MNDIDLVYSCPFAPTTTDYDPSEIIDRHIKALVTSTRYYFEITISKLTSVMYESSADMIAIDASPFFRYETSFPVVKMMQVAIRYNSFAQISYQSMTTWTLTIYFNTSILPSTLYTHNSIYANTPIVDPNYTVDKAVGVDNGMYVFYVRAGRGFAGGGATNVQINSTGIDLVVRSAYETPLLGLVSVLSALVLEILYRMKKNSCLTLSNCMVILSY